MTDLDTSRAACRGFPVTIFFGNEEDRTTHQAKQICAGCEIRQACLDYAVDNNEKEGVWGGLTASERLDARIIRRRRLRDAR